MLLFEKRIVLFAVSAKANLDGSCSTIAQSSIS
uniref:Uncharacterized protein n=1 Tax=Anopheles albimanus TaxID=7167 RepID=A0A182FX51_ANOAL